MIGRMIIKYLPKEVMHKPRAIKYDMLIDKIRKQMVIADPIELELAMRLGSLIKKLNVGGLIMEIKTLKGFGKEVGLKIAEMNKMDEKELIDTICNNVDPSVQYSKDLVAWYNDLPDEYFEKRETQSEDGETGITEISIDDIIETIREVKKIAEIKEVLEDENVAALMADFDANKYKLPTQLKKAAIEYLEHYKEQQPTEKESEMSNSNEIIEAVLACTNEDELGEVFNEYTDTLAEIEIPDDEVDFDTLKSTILEQLGYEGEAEGEKKDEFDPDNFDPNDFDPDAAYAYAEKLKMPQLRKFAKEKLELTIKVGTKMTDILEMVQNRIMELAEGGAAAATKETDVELTPELIEELATSGDTESLLEICNQLEIKLNILQKKSAIIMKKLILAKLPESKPEQKETKPKGRGKLKAAASTDESTETAESIYSLMESMVVNGEKEPAIVKAVKPYYESKGKSALFIKKRVSQMVKIIKLDNDLE
jgi:hypothetical protein